MRKERYTMTANEMKALMDLRQVFAAGSERNAQIIRQYTPGHPRYDEGAHGRASGARDVYNLAVSKLTAFIDSAVIEADAARPQTQNVISGTAATRQITLDGKLINPELSRLIYNHSPDGFAWGYAGSGPDQDQTA